MTFFVSWLRNPVKCNLLFHKPKSFNTLRQNYISEHFVLFVHFVHLDCLDLRLLLSHLAETCNYRGRRGTLLLRMFDLPVWGFFKHCNHRWTTQTRDTQIEIKMCGDARCVKKQTDTLLWLQSQKKTIYGSVCFIWGFILVRSVFMCVCSDIMSCKLLCGVFIEVVHLCDKSYFTWILTNLMSI